MIIDWVFVAANSRVGSVRINESETKSGLGYVIPPTGAWIREDDKEIVLNKLVPVCCKGKYMKPVSLANGPLSSKPEPIVIEEKVIEEIKSNSDIEYTDYSVETSDEEETTKPKRTYKIKEE